jgi:hypothetical protein
MNIMFHLYSSLCSSRLRSPRRQPSILHPSLFFSLEKSFNLPIYTDAMAHAFIADLATPKAILQFVGHYRILQYLDLSAVVADVSEELSLDGGDDQLSNSSHSTSGKYI